MADETSDELAALDATAQAELVRSGDVQPTELVEAAVLRAERLDPELGALIHPAFERALTRAKDPSLAGPFRGVPFAMKDIGGGEAGLPHHAGLGFVARAGFTETEDATLTRRFRAAGLVSIGRTNTPELALLPTTECAAYGATRNPWNLAHSSGGSSGGASALVAAGVVPAAHASDGGGSIRGPASMCALVGLKPTRGRSSFGPGLGERWSGFSSEFVVTRTVRDSAALLDAVAGPAPGDPYFAPPPERPFADAAAGGAAPLRVGVLRGPLRDLTPDPAIREAVNEVARTLESLGHRVEESHPEVLDEAAHVGAYVAVVCANVARALEAWGAKVGVTPGPDDVEPLTWALAERGRALSATDHLATLETVHGFGRRLAAWWGNGFDVLLTPTQGALPPEIGFISSTPDEPLRAFLRASPFGAYTLPFNLSGQPAISLPGGIAAGDLPVGVQLVARYAREDVLLRVAADLERARPWRERRPALHA